MKFAPSSVYTISSRSIRTARHWPLSSQLRSVATLSADAAEASTNPVRTCSIGWRWERGEPEAGQGGQWQLKLLDPDGGGVRATVRLYVSCRCTRTCVNTVPAVYYEYMSEFALSAITAVSSTSPAVFDTVEMEAASSPIESSRAAMQANLGVVPGGATPEYPSTRHTSHGVSH